jgi:hypothetical protein
MQNRISKNSLFYSLLATAAFALPGSAIAQQIEPEWTPMDDSAAQAGYGEEAGSDSARHRGGNDGNARGNGRSGPNVEITPFIEAQQVLVADLQSGGDVLTYSTVAVGVDASVQTRRAEAQLNVRYERMIGYSNDIEDSDIVTGLARGTVALTRGLSFEAGGIATRTKVDGRGASPTNLVGNPDNVSQVYSVYAGPTYSSQIGELNVNAAYRAGYTKVESKDVGSLPPGQDRYDTFDDSISHSATASVGMQPGALPVGWSVGVGYDREDAGQLDGRFESKHARGDVTVPLGAGLAIVGGVGYEDIKVSERDALRDAADVPIVDGNGRLVTDKASPRLTAYREDGVIWDVGVMWRPSSRTTLSGYYGHRYGSDTYGANLSYQPNNLWAVNASVYDTVSGFGNMLNDNLAALPTSFRASRNPLSGDIGGCAFGQSGGFCFNDALQSTASASFRTRGVSAALSSTVGGWETGIAAGYDRRKYLTSALGARADLAGLVDQNYFAAIYLGKDMDGRSRFDTNAYASYYDPGFTGAGDVLGVGINAAYYRQIVRGLSATAAVGLDSSRQEDFDTDLTGSALLGLRYSF